MSTVLRSPKVSGQHLSIRWDGEHWQLRDLASRNGTRLNGQLLPPGEDVVLKKGAVIEVGTTELCIHLRDDGPPIAMACSGEERVEGDESFLALPSAAAPEAVILLEPVEGWLCSKGEQQEPIEDGQTITVSGRAWQLVLPSPFSVTQTLLPPAPAGMSLQLRVSQDQEYVEVTAIKDEQRIPLPPRSHHSLLFSLARLRQQDQSASESEQGWVYHDVLCREVQMSTNQLYVSIHRLRKELEAIGMPGHIDIIERRKTTRQLRLGLSRFSIEYF